jgi:hypothetical protein
MYRFSLRLSACLFSLFCAAAIVGCGSKDVPAKTVLTDQDKQQIEELNKQRLDEWGKPIK